MRNRLMLLVIATPLLLSGCASGPEEFLDQLADLFEPSSSQRLADEGYGWGNEANANPSGRSDVKGDYP
jgi:hypothetical protein